MHPGSDGWQLSPPIPGTQVGQDLYIARTRPTEHGYSDFEPMYAIFATKKKALAGNPEDTLATYHDVAGVFAVEKRLSDVYRFHRLVNVRGVPSAYDGRGRGRFGS